ncbi:protocadherin Fat 1-like [Engraulis encrasicolus]|uniref:protocadherin Fat 1-like n=1 Tax=Engraulis encrasicolus TaxID=184585 RepID=UPI002FD342A2
MIANREPPSDTFEVTSDGQVKLKTELNHAVTKFYTFNVTAKDIGNKSDTTVVNVTVIDGPRFEYNMYCASVSDNKVGPIENIDPAPIKADVGNKYSVFYHISAVHPIEYLSHFIMNNRSGIITIQRKLSQERTSTVNLDIQASLENGSGEKANATVILNVENGPEVDNNPPVFSLQVYTKEIYSVLPVGSPVLEVKATDPDVGETEALQYSLGEPSSLFDIEPSNGQVYVASDIHPGNVTLIVKATDLQGESGTATVEIIVKESGEHNIARMSLNKPYAMVEEKCTSIEDALGRAMAWEVDTVKITAHENKQLEAEKELSERSDFQTDIHFIAMAMSGSEQWIMHKDDVKRMVEREKERVLEELRPVLGPDVDLDMVDETPWRKFIIQVLLATLAGMVVLSVTSIGVMLIKRRKREPRRGSQDSMDAMPPFYRRGSQDSMEAMPPFYISSPPTQANMHNNMHARMEFQHGPYQMSPYGRSYR